MARTRLSIPDMSCGHCEVRIRKALLTLPGIRDLFVDLETRKVELDYDDSLLSADRIRQILAEEDYPVADIFPL
ncbi:MAG: heavy-metal-associated domain-containing protein [Candidatus Xenobium sp.]|jgi:copper chaperone|nr:heavy-metal-associated domain-containing protein [Burkholderiales bacterium]